MEPKKKNAVKNLIETGNLKEFKDIFLYVGKKDVFRLVGGNYGTFLRQINNPKSVDYDLTYRIAHIFNVPPMSICGIICAQIDGQTTVKK